MLTQKRLKELLYYNPENGIFTWKVCPNTNNRVKIGDIAGGIDEGYVRIRIDSKIYRAQRLSFLYMTGKFPKKEVDHINGLRDDNRWKNLRDVSKSVNQQNTFVARCNNKSTSLLGSYPQKNKFKAMITANNITYYLGLYDTQELAHFAYMKAKYKLHNIGTPGSEPPDGVERRGQ